MWAGSSWRARRPPPPIGFAIITAVHDDRFRVETERGGTIEVLGCSTCTPALQRERFCPDLGDDDPSPPGRRLFHLGGSPRRGVRGTHEFQHCPAYYRRHPLGWPGLPFAVGVEHPFEVVCAVSHDLESGALRLRELPGRLYDLVTLRMSEERRRADAARLDAAAEG